MSTGSNIIMQNCLIVIIFLATGIQGILYPRESPTRSVKRLDGIWNFRTSPVDDVNIGFRGKWFSRPLSKTGQTIPMPVPSSFNDIAQEKSIRDFIGWSWYETQFYVEPSWLNDDREVILRFSSVNYYAIVYLNGIEVSRHVGGHLPFEASVIKHLIKSSLNLLVVAVNNTLSNETLPQAVLEYPTDPKKYPKNFHISTPHFDFFNYAGIHRSVHLYSVPKLHLDEVQITSSFNGNTGLLSYKLDIQKKGHRDRLRAVSYILELWDQEEESRISVNRGGLSGNISVSNVQPWWPYLMDPKPGYLYHVVIKIEVDGKLVDHYWLKLGFRTVQFTEKSFTINGKPFYFTGFGKHEDSEIRGRGLDLPILVKDFNLIKWIGANSFRTSHYPYFEELMDLADSQGIVVIDECPAVGLDSFDDKMLQLHLNSIRELIQRDYNHPSVVMWSIANEPYSTRTIADQYFKRVVEFTRQFDNTRPITAAINATIDEEKMAPYLDVLEINRYYSWYLDTGYTQVVRMQLVNEMKEWFHEFKKPIMISEYGADTIAGFHSDPPSMFTEDYQTEMMMEWFKGFDDLRKEGFFVGELIWNFADFMTTQDIIRAHGNREGVFTRDRQPKAAAKLLRCRYTSINNATPTDNMYCPIQRNLIH